MKILIAHNAYQQRGGEDAVVEAEAELLRSRGHEVSEYRRHNDEFANVGRTQAAFGTLWPSRTRTELAAMVQAVQPNVLHGHNTFPLISPSLYWAAADCGVPVVQTLHNFSRLCPPAVLLRLECCCKNCVVRLLLTAVVSCDSKPKMLYGLVLLVLDRKAIDHHE